MYVYVLVVSRALYSAFLKLFWIIAPGSPVEHFSQEHEATTFQFKCFRQGYPHTKPYNLH